MSETVIDAAPPGAANATVAPIATPAAAQPAAPIAPPVADDPDVVKMPSKKLAERLAEEAEKGAKRAAEQFAKDLGIPLADAKKLIAEAKAKDDAAKSEVQRLTEQLAAERAKLAEFDSYKGAVEAQAAAEMASLTEAQRAAVEGLAKTPADRLKAIAALRPTWAAVAQAQADAQKAAQEATAKAAADAAAAVKSQPATTAPALTAPAPTAPGSPPDYAAQYAQLLKSDPYRAAQFYALNASRIVAQRTP